MQPGTPPPADDPYGQRSPPQYPGVTPTPGTGQPYQPAPPPTGGYYAPPGYGAPPPAQPNNTLGLLGMIFGIAGIPLAAFCGLFSLPVGAAGLVLGILGMRRASEGRATNRGMALAGVICGAVSIVVMIISIIVGAAIIASSS